MPQAKAPLPPPSPELDPKLPLVLTSEARPVSPPKVPTLQRAPSKTPSVVPPLRVPVPLPRVYIRSLFKYEPAPGPRLIHHMTPFSSLSMPLWHTTPANGPLTLSFTERLLAASNPSHWLHCGPCWYLTRKQEKSSTTDNCVPTQIFTTSGTNPSPMKWDVCAKELATSNLTLASESTALTLSTSSATKKYHQIVARRSLTPLFSMKSEDEPNCTCITIGGNSIYYPGDNGTSRASLEFFKILINSILSRRKAKIYCFDVSNFYLGTPLNQP